MNRAGHHEDNQEQRYGTSLLFVTTHLAALRILGLEILFGRQFLLRFENFRQNPNHENAVNQIGAHMEEVLPPTNRQRRINRATTSEQQADEIRSVEEDQREGSSERTDHHDDSRINTHTKLEGFANAEHESRHDNPGIAPSGNAQDAAHDENAIKHAIVAAANLQHAPISDPVEQPHSIEHVCNQIPPTSWIGTAVSVHPENAICIGATPAAI